MDAALKLKLVERVNCLEGREFLLGIISLGAAPTIKDRKPSSLLTFTISRKDLLSNWLFHKQEVCETLNLDHLELKNREKSTTVLFYKRALLEKHVAGERNRAFLCKAGYPVASSLEQKLHLLKEKFGCSCPHEIGIFLGIPVEDVEGFIRHRGKNPLLCGYWKVYHHRERAETLFYMYDQAKISVAGEILK